MCLLVVAWLLHLVASQGLDAFETFNNTDWRDSIATRFPFPDVHSLADCVKHCQGDDECVAVVYNPNMSQAVCQLKCSAYAESQYTVINATAVIVKPNATTCPKPSWFPNSWHSGINSGTLLLAGPREPGGHIGNGYVASYMMSLPGSIGPTQSGIEYIAGVFVGSAYVKPRYPKWPNTWCISWCDRAHRMVIPSWTSTARLVSIDGQSVVETASAQDLDNHTYMLASTNVDNTVFCVQRIYAHRKLKHIVATEFHCSNEGVAPVAVQIRELGPSPIVTRDGTWVTPPMGETDVIPTRSGVDGVKCNQYKARVSESQSAPATLVAECHTICDQKVFHVHAGKTSVYYCLSARHSSVDETASNLSPLELANRSLFEANMSRYSLFESHTAEMRELLLPGIEVTGNVELSRTIHATWEAFLQTFRDDTTASPGSGGLGSDGYAGMGGSWDYELWHFPTLNIFHPSISRKFLQYRVDRKNAAHENALAMHNKFLPNRSFDGLAYPWMEAFVGNEQNPDMIAGTSIEDHLQGDVAFGFLQHFRMTNDAQWLRDAGFPVIDGLAQFWMSRVDQNRDGTYSIRGTLPPDEYASPNSSDCVFTNAVARLNLLSAHRLATDVGKSPNDTYLKVANGLRILYDDKVDYHPQCEGYVRGTMIKQGDVVMLGYPLRMSMAESTLRKDMEIYGAATDPNGPAMTWSIHSVVSRYLGDEAHADTYFKKAYANYVRGAFKIWHEGYGTFGGITNFITGSGGWLQSLWAGYGGLRINDSFLEIVNPRPPPNCSSLQLRRVNYLGNVLNILITSAYWKLQLVSSCVNASILSVEANHHVQRLGANPISLLPGSRAKIYKVSTATEIVI